MSKNRDDVFFSKNTNRDLDILNNHQHGVDVIDLLFVILRNKYFIIIGTLSFLLVGFFFSSLNKPTKSWSSSSFVSVSTKDQYQPLDSDASLLSVLNIDVDITSEDIFSEFKRYYLSQDSLDKYLSNIKYNYSSTVSIIPFVPAENTLVNSESSHNYVLSFSSSSNSNIKSILTGYINYVNEQVNDDINRQINMIIQTAQKTATEEYQLAFQMALNEQKIRIQRLEYAVSIAKAAGLQKPTHDAFDALNNSITYPISLGYDALNRQLEIEKSVTDPTTVNLELLNQKLYLNKIMALQPISVDIQSFSYLQPPSDPVVQSDKKHLLIMILFSFVGLLGSISFVLIRHYVRERKSNLSNSPKE